jgi:hypothetical protein
MALTTVSPALLDTQAQYTGFKNRIINGNMAVWQHGTSGFTSGYAVDRWFLNGANVASQSTDVPSGYKYSFSATNSSATLSGVSQRIESMNCTDLVGQSVTVSFWFKRTGSTGNLLVNLDFPLAADNYTSTSNIGSTQVSASPAISWTQYTVTFNNLPSGVANGLQVSLFSTNGAAASLGGLITGVQLEKGTAATSFDVIDYGRQLALCYRYSWVWSQTSGYSWISTGGQWISTTALLAMVRAPVPMRASPTATYPTASLMAVTNSAGSAISCTTLISSWTGNEIFGITAVVGAATGVAGQSGFLGANNSPVSVSFSAEL